MKIWNLRGVCLLAFLFSSGAVARKEEAVFEASGVCRLGASLVIAGDENPNSFWVIEDHSHTVKTVEVRNGEWDDMEDLSAVDDRRFFAMTSHSRTKKGNLKPGREQLLLISRKKSHFEVDHSWSLRKEILAALDAHIGGAIDLATVDKATPSDGGLNVEGLAYSNGQLFVGLRSPLTDRGEALVLRIKNATALLEGGHPAFSEVIRLPLGRRGVRGLTSYGEGLLVIAGASDDNETGFALYRAAMSSAKVTAFLLPGFASLVRPEGLVAENDGSFTFVQDFEAATDQDVVVKLPGRVLSN